MPSVQERANRVFERVFGRSSSFGASAPGRVNLIGEHTDYNEGFVLPTAIVARTSIACDPRPFGETVSRLCFPDFNGERPVEIELAGGRVGSRSGDSVSAVWRRVREALPETALHRLPAAIDAVITGDVPIGVGLSSSAALEVATALALLTMAGETVTAGGAITGVRVARICQDAEHDVGVPCGIMDPFISIHGREDSALLIDCRDLSWSVIAFGDHSSVFVISDSGVRRDIGEGAYAERRSACERAAALLGEKSGGRVCGLRDATVEDLALLEGVESGMLLRRARHVVTENTRTLRAASALVSGDFRGAGACMNQSHESLRDDFEVSLPELDALVESARAFPGVFGSRMTGAGFGGCTVTLVEARRAQGLIAHLMMQAARDGRPAPRCFVSRASAGARVERAPVHN